MAIKTKTTRSASVVIEILQKLKLKKLFIMEKILIIVCDNGDAIICSSTVEYINNGISVKTCKIISKQTGKEMDAENFFISNDKVMYSFSPKS